jgi:hypothetical protein
VVKNILCDPNAVSQHGGMDAVFTFIDRADAAKK